MRLKPPKIIRRLMPDLIWEIDDRDGVFLTFDDGPTPGVTEWILSTLDKYDAKATFFVLGKNVEMYPDLYQRILDAGHRVGNHTYSHMDLNAKGVPAFQQDFQRFDTLAQRRGIAAIVDQGVEQRVGVRRRRGHAGPFKARAAVRASP